MSKIYITGAGPGFADLLTVRAARVLGRAGAVLYDRLVSPEVLEMAAPGAELHDVGKVEGRQEIIQKLILELLEDCALRHEIVVRLKGGDPMVYGRGAEEWLWLVERGWDVEIVPGVSSAIAVPALAGIPLSFRGVAAGFAVVTGRRPDGPGQDWAAYANVDTLVVLMGVAARAEIAARLIQLGRSAETPVAFVENGASADERVTVSTLRQVAAGEVEVLPPAVIVVGEVVRLREKLAQAAGFDLGVDLRSLLQAGEAHAGQPC